MEKKKTLTKVLIIVAANLLMLIFGVLAFFTILHVRDALSEKAVGTCLEEIGVRYQTIEIFSARSDDLCAVLTEDGKYALYSIEGSNNDIQLYLLWDDMDVGEKLYTPSRVGEYLFAVCLYENKEEVPSNAYTTAELKTENTTVYFCVEYFVLGDITNLQ